MAEVTFSGFGPASGFSTPDAQLTNQTASTAEVQLGPRSVTGFGTPDSKPVSNVVSAAEVSYEGVQADYGQGLTATVVATYSNSNAIGIDAPQVELVNQALPVPYSINPNVNLFTLMPTGAAAINTTTFLVVNSEMPGEPTYLNGINGPNALVGKVIQFGAPTGGGQSALQGVTGAIASHTDGQLTLVAALPAVPTLSDTITIGGISRLLRRSPVIEIILE